MDKTFAFEAVSPQDSLTSRMNLLLGGKLMLL